MQQIEENKNLLHDPVRIRRIFRTNHVRRETDSEDRDDRNGK